MLLRMHFSSYVQHFMLIKWYQIQNFHVAFPMLGMGNATMWYRKFFC
jgi:hypothetical protein